ncbi:UNVERIFIED_CONTAM: hypothetical protein Sradi_7142500 [Sesamum radiatum]|uniref:Uncharacterized protein n=1 Tax=Sesamum radiatum TaxID=300843 RepID=A0AAW2IWZ8_SESRA
MPTRLGATDYPDFDSSTDATEEATGGRGREYPSQAGKEKELSMTFNSLEGIRSGIYSEVGCFDSLSVD